MPDQIYTAGPLDAPVTYQVPGSSEIIPLACHATFDGSGASSAFVPALIFRSQAGHVIARAAVDTTVAAGASASVSWFPGGLAKTTGSAPSTSGLPAAYARTDPFAVGAGSFVTPDYTVFQTNLGSLFSHPGGNPSWVQIADPGVYMTFTTLLLVTSPTSLTGVVRVLTSIVDTFGNPVFTIWANPVDIRDATAGDPKEVTSAQGFSIEHTDTDTDSPYHATVAIFSAVALNVSAIITYIRQDSPTPLS